MNNNTILYGATKLKSTVFQRILHSELTDSDNETPTSPTRHSFSAGIKLIATLNSSFSDKKNNLDNRMKKQETNEEETKNYPDIDYIKSPEKNNEINKKKLKVKYRCLMFCRLTSSDDYCNHLIRTYKGLSHKENISTPIIHKKIELKGSGRSKI